MVKLRETSIERLNELLCYDPASGVFTWRVSRPKYRCFAGQEAGFPDHQGYRYISIDQLKIKAHRIAWAMHYCSWPQGNIDHINGKRSDNRIANLRIANQHQNIANAGLSIKNTSGFKGVSPTPNGTWAAGIKVHGKRHNLGKFKTKEEAARAYQDAAKKYFGEFARNPENW